MAHSFSFNQVRRFYEQSFVVDSYATSQDLFPAEKQLFESHQSAIDQKRLLDIGVGSGRTTVYLQQRVAHYVGIDYSAGMIKRCKQKFKHLDFRWGDARQLDFEAESFDAVVFSFNGIDSVPNEDRLRILQEINRVLSPGGLLIFSSHNLDYPRKSAYAYEGIYWHPNPLTFIKENYKDLRKYVKNIRNHQRNKKLEVHHDGYALINDQMNSYSLLVYYTSKKHQCQQLKEQGFDDIQMVDHQGQFLSIDQPCRDPWIYYAAKKIS
ncbi:MAG: class I SAM-dependent methyltransferase [Bacteroidota bacterium]